MGKPAAFIGCYHTCPDRTGKIPHVGGPVAVGSPNVFIGGMPAARKGDKLVCIGPPDSISSGSSGVFINGKPAARMGDSTSHGGKIIAGNGTVLIGEQCSGPAGGNNNGYGETSDPQALATIPTPEMTAHLEAIAANDIPLTEICQKKNDGSCPNKECKCK
ncbi:PAAR domain-containing protein [Photobacterium kagoshimensis]